MSKSERWQQRIAGLHKRYADMGEADRDAFFSLWHYRGRFRDLGNASGTCGLCGNTGLRYQFMVVQEATGEALWVGSACILNFDLPEKAVQARVRRAVRKADRRTEIRVSEEEFLEVLAQLKRVYRHANADEQRYLRWMAGKFQRRGGFSPKEIGWLYRASLAAGERLDPACLPKDVRTAKDRQEWNNLSLSTKAWWESGRQEEN